MAGNCENTTYLEERAGGWRTSDEGALIPEDPQGRSPFSGDTGGDLKSSVSVVVVSASSSSASSSPSSRESPALSGLLTLSLREGATVRIQADARITFNVL